MTNFGPLVGGWVRVQISELGYDVPVRAYGSDRVLLTARKDHPDFAGLVGLPLLRSLLYGGNPGSFWIRSLTGTP
jgi:hypothetical protein